MTMFIYFATFYIGGVILFQHFCEDDSESSESGISGPAPTGAAARVDSRRLAAVLECSICMENYATDDAPRTPRILVRLLLRFCVACLLAPSDLHRNPLRRRAGIRSARAAWSRCSRRCRAPG